MPTTIKGDKELRAKLKKLADPKQLVPGLVEGAKQIKRKVAPYPSGNQHRPQPFKSVKQRRYFFWALRNGKIEVPYRRGQSPGSQDHEQSWTIKGMKGGLQQIVGSDTTYGPYLQDPKMQTAYHKQTGWKDTDTVAREESDEVLDQLKKRVDRILARG